MIPDLSALLPQDRRALADRIRVSTDFQLPPLEFFNSEPCARHPTLDAGRKEYCRDCGIVFRRHQRVGVAWSFMAGRGLIADSVGTGKTAQAAGLLAMARQAGELDSARALVVVRASALMQWVTELNRFLPRMAISAAVGSRKERVEKYLRPWEVMVLSYQMLQQDFEAILNFQVRNLIVDDVDALRNPGNKTSYQIKTVADNCRRVLILTGTPLQKKLEELYSVTEPIGGRAVFGPVSSFKRRYIREEKVIDYTRNGNRITKREVVGYKNLDEFSARIAPLVLRRTAADIEDVDLPAILPNTVWLDLHPRQKDLYKRLRDGVRRAEKSKESISQAKAKNAFLLGAQICSGMATLGEEDGPGASTKLDWLDDKLTGDLAGEKVVVFMNFKNTIRAFHQRMATAGIELVTIWGEDNNAQRRHQALERFWRDPACRVLVGTTSIEQSLNLQISRHLVNVDQIMNPARMEQLAGRVRRDGSAHHTVYVHNLLCKGTQEEGYVGALAREQAVIDAVWGEKSVLQQSLTPEQLLHLIGRSTL